MFPELKTDPPIDFAGLNNLGIQQHTRTIVQNASAAAREQARSELQEHDEARAELGTLDGRILEAEQRRAKRYEDIAGLRAERGDALANGSSAGALDKRLATLRGELERDEDELAALRSRRPATEKAALISKWHASRVFRNALSQRREQGDRTGAEAKAVWEIALGARDGIRELLDHATAAQSRDYDAVRHHKQQHPLLYPEE
jgi:chromosome segregation ATPase